jgi:RND family efflux transporter MFP subunit
MKSVGRKTVFLSVLLIGAAWIGLVLIRQQDTGFSGEKGKTQQSAPVEVAQIRRGPIELRRTFSGTLEARAKFIVAPKVSGRVERLAVNLADTVKRGQVVAELDNDEYVQAVAQAAADLEVAKANLAEAKSTLEIATRELERTKTLRSRGVASESQLDAANANYLARQAQLEIATAQVTKEKSSLESANIRLGYTMVRASWTGGSKTRVVAERYVDEGGTVSANASLLLIVELDPIKGVIYVTEKDYARMRAGQSAMLTTDAYPGETFSARIDRISPVFRQAPRQARVELTIRNPEQILKPGMFIRVTVVLARVAEATIVPEQALTTRDNKTGVFVVREDGESVAWRTVTVGIREDSRVQVEGDGLTGRVVVLGQQLVDDGSRITIPDLTREAPSKDPKAESR